MTTRTTMTTIDRTEIIDEGISSLEVSMRKKLDENCYKGTWQEMSDLTLLRHAQTEIDELLDAILKEPDENILLECADVANFVMFIHDNAKRRIDNDKENQDVYVVAP